MKNSFNSKSELKLKQDSYQFYDITKLQDQFKLQRLPFCLKILLENLLRHEDGVNVGKQDILAIANWQPTAEPKDEISFTPSRVILQDFTGVPAIVDLATMREAMQDLGGNPDKINPLSPVELVIDHSVMVDNYGSATALKQNTNLEFERNRERYTFLRWGQENFADFRVVPPGTGIVHQVNLEYLARMVFTKDLNAEKNLKATATKSGELAYPDTLVGTDSHTTMINGLGVLGWGVGGIEAEAAMLGQPITMLIPQVIGFKLTGKLPSGATATDLVLTVVQNLRQHGVVGKFVEFFGDGLAQLSLADRATIANMAPEYGATCGIFPIDNETINYLKLSGRAQHTIELAEAYYKAQGMFHTADSPEAEYTATLTLDLASVAPCIAGPKRPQDKILLSDAKEKYLELLKTEGKDLAQQVQINPQEFKSPVNADAIKTNLTETIDYKNTDNNLNLSHGMLAIAAITSCTNTSNPEVMITAGLLAKAAIEQGLTVKPWVKTSLAPGSQVVTDYLAKSNLQSYLDQLGFNIVGYGCTTCIGNSGPLPTAVSKVIKEQNLTATAVLSGNRNFEGRIHPDIKHAYLASPPLVVAYALAGTMNFDFANEPLAVTSSGKKVFLKDLWPERNLVQDTVNATLNADMFKKRYHSVFTGSQEWQKLTIPKGKLYAWEQSSTYVKKPSFFANMTEQPQPLSNIDNAYALLKLGDSVTTDHISPAGIIAPDSPAGEYLLQAGVKKENFNSYGSRRGNHEVMLRGTFANIRLRNQLAPGTEGSWTMHFPSQEKTSIYAAAMRYQQQQTPLIIIAGKEYGSGSSRDWAAKGTSLLGVNVVIAESFERIHRSNLIGMGVLPLQFMPEETAEKLNITGSEVFSIALDNLKAKGTVTVTIKIRTCKTESTTESNLNRQTTSLVEDKTNRNTTTRNFNCKVRIDTPKELEYYEHGGILHYVLRNMLRD